MKKVKFLIGFTNNQTVIINANNYDDAVSIGIMLAMERKIQFAYAYEM